MPCFSCRYVKHRRSILQPHHLLDKLNNIADVGQVAEIKESAFGNLLENCQVLLLEIVHPRNGRGAYLLSRIFRNLVVLYSGSRDGRLEIETKLVAMIR